jgi:hypothetical protein
VDRIIGLDCFGAGRLGSVETGEDESTTAWAWPVI